MMLKGRALRRALATTDAHRVGSPLPQIVDTTEMITPETAYQMLLLNKNNRPINWQKVEEYAAAMKRGEWELHAQGIVLDHHGNVLTGQKRLWAVIYSNETIPMRVSRGSPTSAARLLDRHTPQTARDLATRGTGKKHSPVEASLARARLVLQGEARPSTDRLAEVIEENALRADALLKATSGTKKTRAVLMILAALCAPGVANGDATRLALRVGAMAASLGLALAPQTPEQCWGRGAAFALAMKEARRIVDEAGAAPR